MHTRTHSHSHSRAHDIHIARSLTVLTLPATQPNHPFDLGARHAARSVGWARSRDDNDDNGTRCRFLPLPCLCLASPCLALPALSVLPCLAFAYFLACLACFFSCSSLACLTRIALRAEYTRRYFFSHSNRQYMHRLLSGHLHYCCYCCIYHPTTTFPRNTRLYIESFFALSQPNALVALVCFFCSSVSYNASLVLAPHALVFYSHINTKSILFIHSSIRIR